EAVLRLSDSVEGQDHVLDLVPRVRNGEVALVLRLEGGLLFGILEPVFPISEADRVDLARCGEVMSASPRVFDEVAQRLRVNRLQVNDRGKPVSEIEVELAGRAAAEPLAVADDDVEGRGLVAEVQKDLILVIGPGE